MVGVTRAENLPKRRRNPTNMASLRKWMAIQDSDKPELSSDSLRYKIVRIEDGSALLVRLILLFSARREHSPAGC